MILIMVNPLAPDPSPSECSTMLTHADDMIANLNKVLEQLDAVSDEPDAALVAIKGQVKTMITEAMTIKAKLGTIKSNASQMESDPIPEPYKRKGVLVDGLDDTIS